MQVARQKEMVSLGSQSGIIKTALRLDWQLFPGKYTREEL
jgi:hypothetical protein